MRRFLASLALAFGLLFLANSDEAFGASSIGEVNSVSQIRATNWGTYATLNLLSYYDGQGQGGGQFKKSMASCATTITADLVTGQNTLKNLSGSVYIGETVSGITVGSNKTIAAISFNRVLSAGIWTNGASSITSIPDTTNIQVGMLVNGVRIADGTKVTSKTAPTTVITAHGSIHNGRVITITSTSGTILAGMYVTAIANNDTLPKVFPDSVAVSGLVTVGSVVGSTVTTTGSLGLAGVATDITFHFTSTDGAVGISTPTTGAEASSTPLLFRQNNATMSGNASVTANASTVNLNGDDGGVHIIDSAGNCWVRSSGSPDVLGWGAVPDNSTDSTGPLQNDLTYNSISTQPGPAGSVYFPAGITGIFKVSTLLVFKPNPFGGQGLETSIIQQNSGLAAETPTIYYFQLYDQSNRWGVTYLPPGTAIRNMTIRGPTDATTTGNETIGIYYDGYNGTPQVTDTDTNRAFIQELQIDGFKGFGMYASRAAGTVGSFYKVHIRGITPELGSNDCLHSDGPFTWGIYYIITAACDSGLYLNSPTSWSFFRSVAFSNNHAATLTGTISSDLNNAQINLGDLEFGFNKQNGLVIDSQGLRVSLLNSRVNDSGQVATTGQFSDIEITANASVALGPVLEVITGHFTSVHSEVSGQNHLNNITFDDGATAQVAIDSTTTTSSPAQKIWTNLATCAGCTSQINTSPPLVNSLLSAADSLVAHAGGGQANATPITTDIARFQTVASDFDSAQLPLSFAGRCIAVSNGSATHALKIYANVSGTDTINGIAGSTGIFASPKTTEHICSPSTGVWTTAQFYVTGTGAICPTSEACVWTGVQTINRNPTAAPSAVTGTVLQVVGANGSPTTIEVDAFAGTPQSILRRADGTNASPTAVLSGEVLANFGARPYDGTAYATASTGNVQPVANENFSNTAHGTDIVTNCTTATTIVTAECARIKATGINLPANSTYQMNGVIVPYTLAQSGAAVSAPADTTEDTLATITVPANAMAANGCIEITAMWTTTNSANTKTLRVKFGGTSYYSSATTTTATSTSVTRLCNANATNSQVGGYSARSFGNDAQTGPLVTTAIDTTSSATILLTGQKASAGETLTLNQYSVLLQPHS